MVRVAAVQMKVSENMEENLTATLRFMEQAAEQGAKLVCFPEGHLAPYLPPVSGTGYPGVCPL